MPKGRDVSRSAAGVIALLPVQTASRKSHINRQLGRLAAPRRGVIGTLPPQTGDSKNVFRPLHGEIDAWIRSGSPPRRTEADSRGAETASGEQPDLQEVISAFTVERDGRRCVVVPLGNGGAGRNRGAQRKNREEKYRELLEKAPVWIWETDAAGRYQYSNGEVARILGCRPQDIVGKKLSDLEVLPEDLARVAYALDSLRTDGGCIKHLEYCIANRDGELRRLRTYAEATLDGRGNFAGIRGVSCDVTDLEPPRGKAK